MPPPDNSSRFGISRHFRREAKIMVGFFVLLLLLGLVAGIVGPFFVEHFGAHK
jgi:hypothetical protein